MTEPPFGFGPPGGSGSGGDPGTPGGGGGSGEGSGPPGPFGGMGPLGPMGPMGDPQQFAEALRQFADRMAWQGGPVNWDLAKNIARPTLAHNGDASVLHSARRNVVEAPRLAVFSLAAATE